MAASANGQLRPDELTAVDGVQLAPATAVAWSRMRAACRAATGVDLDIVNYWGGYRDRVMQEALRRNPPAGVVVAPVGMSTHGRGLAVDVTIPTFDKARTWLREHAHAYGFTLGPANDRNHLMHDGTTLGPSTTQPQRRRRAGSMYVAHENPKYPQVYVVFTDANGRERLRPAGPMESAIARAGGLVVPVEDTTLTNLGVESGWKAGTIPQLVPQVAATLELTGFNFTGTATPNK